MDAGLGLGPFLPGDITTGATTGNMANPTEDRNQCLRTLGYEHFDQATRDTLRIHQEKSLSRDKGASTLTVELDPRPNPLTPTR